MKTLPRLLIVSLAALAAPLAAQDAMQDDTFETEADPAPDAEMGVRAIMPARGDSVTELLRAPLSRADGLEVIVADIILEAGQQVPRHYHLAEEIVFLTEGQVVFSEEGRDDIVLYASDAHVIPARTPHSVRAGPHGARAVTFHVHGEGEPERVPVGAE